MEDYKEGLATESEDNYGRALRDMLQMKESFGKLNVDEKDRLIKEAFAKELSEMKPAQAWMVNSMIKTFLAK